MGAVTAGVIAAPAAAYLFSSPKSQGTGDLIEIADLTQLETGKPQEVVFHRTRIDAWNESKEKATAWVVKTGDNSAVAYSPGCPHLGCVYRWEAESFVCPCHASTFGTDGRVLSGPAPRALDRYVSKVEGGKLLIGARIEKSDA